MAIGSQNHSITIAEALYLTTVQCQLSYRLDKLRTLVPHAERANTASFLEEVIHYIEELQALLKCGPNHATGAPATHPSAALAAAVQQQQRQPQVSCVAVLHGAATPCSICRTRRACDDLKEPDIVFGNAGVGVTTPFCRELHIRL